MAIQIIFCYLVFLYKVHNTTLFVCHNRFNLKTNDDAQASPYDAYFVRFERQP